MVLLLYIVGFLGVYYFVHQTEEQDGHIENESPRPVKVVSRQIH